MIAANVRTRPSWMGTMRGVRPCSSRAQHEIVLRQRLWAREIERRVASSRREREQDALDHVARADRLLGVAPPRISGTKPAVARARNAAVA